MVKGISRQVIVVQAPEEKLFEQVIFILNDRAVGEQGVTNETLLKEAKSLIGSKVRRKGKSSLQGVLWACSGAAATGLLWLATMFL